MGCPCKNCKTLLAREIYPCVAYSYKYGESCSREWGHEGPHTYQRQHVVEILPKEPEYGWSPYARFQDRK